MSDPKILPRARLDEIRALTNAATPGPWVRLSTGHGMDQFHTHRIVLNGDFDSLPWTAADYDFVAAARTLVPQLLEHIEAQQETLTKASALAEQLLEAAPGAPSGGWSDEECELLAELCDVLDPVDTDPPSEDVCRKEVPGQ